MNRINFRDFLYTQKIDFFPGYNTKTLRSEAHPGNFMKCPDGRTCAMMIWFESTSARVGHYSMEASHG